MCINLQDNEGSFAPCRFVGDTQPIVMMAIIGFILPYHNPFRRGRPDETRKEAKQRINEPLIPWSIAQQKTAWGVVLLMGGGFALSKIITVRF